MYDFISQIAIFILGAGAIILIAEKNKWGFVLGLAAQPFWFITAIINHQLGVLLVSFIYTISWCFGIYKWFFKNKDKNETE